MKPLPGLLEENIAVISLLISLFLSMKHSVNDMLKVHDNNNRPVATKNVASPTNNKLENPKANNNPITVIKPGSLAPKAESGNKFANQNIKSVNLESGSLESKAATNKSLDAPSDLSQYDEYAKNVSDLKRKIELNKLKAEMYRSSIDYEDPGSYDQATMIGVVVDPHGFKLAHIKLVDDTTTDLMVGSRFGQYIVSDIGINEVTLINSKCKKHKKIKSIHNRHNKHSKHSIDNTDLVIHTNTENNPSNISEEENPLICKPVKIYPLYRDINNRLPVNNSSTRTVGPNGTRVYGGGVQSTTSTNNSMMNSAGAAGSSGTSISSGGMTLTIPPIETGPHGN